MSAADSGNMRIAKAVEGIARQGYFIMEAALEPALVDEVLAEIAQLELDAVPLSLQNRFHGFKTQRYYDVLNYGEVWQRLTTHPSILPVARATLGDDCLLNTYGTSIVGPGESAQPMHVDDGPFIGAKNSSLRQRPFLGEGQWRQPIVLNTMLALCDFTEPLGATRVVPGSHRLAYPKKEDAAKWLAASIPAEMPKGSVLFFEGQCFHGGGANTTQDRRFAVSIDYCAGYLRTQENFLLSISRERASTFSEDLQQLIGLRISAGGLGHVYHHNPDELMARVAQRSTPNPGQNSSKVPGGPA
ncbi:MAG: phytanoyl-CoA dioxygenase [Gammaproteobacteria bacterium]|nr:phytanoyl-CoA dioxygenase [Gammaproteobacteria bacterium]